MPILLHYYYDRLNIAKGEGTIMLSDLPYEKGQDEFEDYKFSGKAWSAPYLEDPARIQELLDIFHLVERRIKKLWLIGLNYLLVRDRIENSVYGSLAGLPEERQTKSVLQKHNGQNTVPPQCPN